MSISIKSSREIELMRRAGRIVANTLSELLDSVEPGMTTKDVDRMADRSIRRQGGDPAFPYVNHFPGSACVSVNQEVVHGIPSKRKLKAGDLVKVDVGALYQGYHGDAAVTIPVGRVSHEAQRLVDVTENALKCGILAARADGFLHDIGAAIEDCVSPSGFGIVRQYVGHGVGRELHEDPTVPHYRQTNRGMRLRPGMTLTIEPMINAGTYDTRLLDDEWTVVTADGRLSAQFEHTVLITEGDAEVLTVPDKGRMWSIPFETANVVQ
jgi:methionyl aminopeptidase